MARYLALLLTPLFASGLAARPTNVALWNSGTCPYAQRSWIALKEKGIAFDLKKVDLKDKEATPEFEETYRRANPNPFTSSKVPILVVTNDEEKGDSQVYTESSVVCEAIEELWPDPPLLPSDSHQRAKARLFGESVYDALFGGSRSAYQFAMRKSNSEEDDDSKWNEEEEKQTLCESLAALETSLDGFKNDNNNSDGPFVLGNQFSLAECMAAPFAQRANAIYAHYGNIDVAALCKSEGYNRAAAWWEAELKRESVVSTGVSAEEIVESSKRVIEMIRARS